MSSGTSGGAALSPTEVAAYISEHRLLQRINMAISDAINHRAPNPLLHMAALLREPLHMGMTQPSLPVAKLPGAARTATAVAAASSSINPVEKTMAASGAATAAASASVTSTIAGATAAAAVTASTSSAGPAAASGLLRPSNTEELARLLRGAGIDLSLWGGAGNKSIRHLLAEINATECSLRQHADGPTMIQRELTRVDVELHLRGRILVETHTQVGGRTLQRFRLLSVRVRDGETWQAGVRRILKSMLRGLGDAPNAYSLLEGSHRVSHVSRNAYSYPGLPTECTRHHVSVVLDERSNTENLGIAVQDRFNTAEAPELMTHVASAPDGPADGSTSAASLGGVPAP
jgi:hypothetical protein